MITEATAYSSIDFILGDYPTGTVYPPNGVLVHSPPLVASAYRLAAPGSHQMINKG